MAKPVEVLNISQDMLLNLFGYRTIWSPQEIPAYTIIYTPPKTNMEPQNW